MKKSRRTYNGVHLNKKSNTQDVVEQSLTQIREQIAFLTERASHVGGKPCKKGKRQGRGGTRHRQERKPENP